MKTDPDWLGRIPREEWPSTYQLAKMAALLRGSFNTDTTAIAVATKLWVMAYWVVHPEEKEKL